MSTWSNPGRLVARLAFVAAGFLPALGVQAALVPFNLGWRFHLGEVPGAEAPAYDDQRWRQVDLPHDWSVEGSAGADPRDRTTPEGDSVGYFRGGIGVNSPGMERVTVRIALAGVPSTAGSCAACWLAGASV